MAEADIYADARANMEALRVRAQGAVFDYASKAGNQAARSYIHALRLEKGRIEAARKAAKEGVLKQGREIDEGAKVLVGEIDDLITVHSRHLEAIEAREKARVQALQSALDIVAAWAMEFEREWQTMTPDRAADLASNIDRVEGGDWQEYAEPAAAAVVSARAAMSAARDRRARYDAEQAELSQLREEARAREEADAAERQAAAQKARDEAIAAAAVVRAENAARERAEAATRAAAAEAQRLIDEANARTAAAEREAAAKVRAIEQAAADKAAAEKRDQLARQQREANAAHVRAINAGVSDLLVQHGCERDAAESAVAAIAAGALPSVRIIY